MAVGAEVQIAVAVASDIPYSSAHRVRRRHRSPQPRGPNRRERSSIEVGCIVVLLELDPQHFREFFLDDDNLLRVVELPT